MRRRFAANRRVDPMATTQGMRPGTQVLSARDPDEVLDTFEQWKAAMIEKGWT